MTATNKLLLISESRGDSNRCTPYRRKPDQYATRFPRSVRVWSKIIRISRGPHIATFHTIINRFERVDCPREEGLPAQSTARRLTDPSVHTQLLSHNSHWSSGEKWNFCWDPTTSLTGPNHRHAIGTFNTCSRGPTHRSLTDTGGGYNFEGAGLPHTTPRPFQPAVSTFPKGPRPISSLTKIHQLNQSVEFENLWMPRGLSTTRPSTVAYIYA
jgi:hypothetical protein